MLLLPPLLLWSDWCKWMLFCIYLFCIVYNAHVSTTSDDLWVCVCVAQLSRFNEMFAELSPSHAICECSLNANDRVCMCLVSSVSVCIEDSLHMENTDICLHNKTRKDAWRDRGRESKRRVSRRPCESCEHFPFTVYIHSAVLWARREREREKKRRQNIVETERRQKCRWWNTIAWQRQASQPVSESKRNEYFCSCNRKCSKMKTEAKETRSPPPNWITKRRQQRTIIDAVICCGLCVLRSGDEITYAETKFNFIEIHMPNCENVFGLSI